MNILATCADDMKVMIWNADTWDLLHVFTSSAHVFGWHTLSYIHLEPIRDSKMGHRPSRE